MLSLSRVLLICAISASLCFRPIDAAAFRTQEKQSSDQSKSPEPQQPSDASPAPSKPKPAPGFAFGLEDGTPVLLKLAREISSATEVSGNRVDFEVAQDIKVKDVIVIPAGAKALGTIVDAKPKRRMGRAGKLDVRIDDVRLADGSRVPLRASQESKGKGRGGAMTTGIIATGILFFPAAPLFLFMHGKDVVIAKGTPVTAYVDEDVVLDESKFSKPRPAIPDSTATPAITPSSTPQTDSGTKPQR